MFYPDGRCHPPASVYSSIGAIHRSPSRNRIPNGAACASRIVRCRVVERPRGGGNDSREGWQPPPGCEQTRDGRGSGPGKSLTLHKATTRVWRSLLLRSDLHQSRRSLLIPQTEAFHPPILIIPAPNHPRQPAFLPPARKITLIKRVIAALTSPRDFIVDCHSFQDQLRVGGRSRRGQMTVVEHFCGGGRDRFLPSESETTQWLFLLCPQNESRLLLLSVALLLFVRLTAL